MTLRLRPERIVYVASSVALGHRKAYPVASRCFEDTSVCCSSQVGRSSYIWQWTRCRHADVDHVVKDRRSNVRYRFERLQGRCSILVSIDENSLMNVDSVRSALEQHQDLILILVGLLDGHKPSFALSIPRRVAVH